MPYLEENEQACVNKCGVSVWACLTGWSVGLLSWSDLQRSWQVSTSWSGFSAFSFSSSGVKSPEALLTRDSHHDEVALYESRKEGLEREVVIEMHMSDKFQKQLSYGTPQGLVTSARVFGHKSCPWKKLQCLCVPYKAVIASMDWIWVEQEMNMRKVCTRSTENSSNKRRRKR